MAKTHKFSKYQREAKKPPFVIEFDDDTENISIPAPDGDTIMDAEESGTTRRFLSIICGEQWEYVEPLIGDLDGDGLIEFAQDLSRHFGMAGEQNEGKRRRSSN